MTREDDSSRSTTEVLRDAGVPGLRRRVGRRSRRRTRRRRGRVRIERVTGPGAAGAAVKGRITLVVDPAATPTRVGVR